MSKHYTSRQMARIMRVISERYTREQTLAMSRAEYTELIATIGRELFA